MKKSTAKSKVSPAPATKPVPAPAAKAPAKKAPPKRKAPAVKPVLAAKPAVTPASAPSAAPAPARPVAALAAPAPVPAPTPVPAAARRPVVTTITARINIGFGNALHLRGEGPGLSWDQGVPMECIAADLWRLNLGESARGYTFKVLVNDLTWNNGPDYAVASGGVVNITPAFP
ncbi:MAG: hypothetical protein FJ381_12750 [Verrucomicrobia bacterium]|nr:hypothetical protein [Verrucomicrobiota bacterium]